MYQETSSISLSQSRFLQQLSQIEILHLGENINIRKRNTLSCKGVSLYRFMKLEQFVFPSHDMIVLPTSISPYKSWIIWTKLNDIRGGVSLKTVN